MEYNDYVFLSTDFGVVKIDVENPAIKETYKNLTLKGDVLKVNKSIIQFRHNTTTQDSIILATSVGILTAPLNASNLIDYSQWTLYDSTNSSFNNEKVALDLTEYNGEIYALMEFENHLFKKTTSKWQQIPNPIEPWVKAFGICSSNGALYVSNSEGFIQINSSGEVIENFFDPIFEEPSLLFIDSQNQEYVIDLLAGFFTKRSNGYFGYLNPNGPYRPDAFNIEFVDGEIVVLSGGYTGNVLFLSFNKSGYFTYDNKYGWTTYSTNRWSPDAWDLTDVAFHKNRQETYFASYSHGLIIKNKEGEYSVIYDSTLVTTANPPFISPLKSTYIKARIATVETDLDGNVWFANYLVRNYPQIYRINTDGTWTSFQIPDAAAGQIHHMKFDNDNNIWAISRGEITSSALLAITKDGVLKKNFSISELNSTPNYVEIDHNGDVWVGTDEGIVIIKNENQMTQFHIERPIIDGRYLLENQIVKGITVDGANRKWVSTSSGVWVFNEDGTKEIHHFTVDNSPLLSDDIIDICIHPETGEVFIATSFGVNSYRAESTESNEDICTDPIKVYPNPVPAGYSGYVGINGVPENALVKITDISGKLVFESNAFGGQAIWDTQDINGNKARTGVYIAYISSEDTENTCVTKIAVIE